MVESTLDIDENDITDDLEVDDEVEEVEDDYVPPTKEEFQKILAAKQKADSEAAARKRFLREAGLDPKTGKPIPKREVKFDFEDEDDEGEEDTADKKAEVKPSSKFDAKAAMREAQRQLEREVLDVETRERERALVLVSAVPEALSDAELNPKYLKRALKHLDLNSVEVDSDGEIEGLQEQIASLKDDFPEFFKRTRMKDAAKEVADTKTVGGGKKTAPSSEETLDWTTRLKNQILKG